MTPTAHAAISLAIGGTVWAVTRSQGAVLSALAAGVLIDLDHLPDYYRYLVLRRPDRFWVFLHAYEWVALALLIAHLSGWDPLAVASIAAFLAHLLCDQFTNPVSPLGYFFTYRAFKRFHAKDLVRVSVEDAYAEVQRFPGGRWIVPKVVGALRRRRQSRLAK